MRLLASRPLSERKRLLGCLTAEQLTELYFDWRARARPEQLPPDGEWQKWLYLGGRGAGKTRSGAEWVRAQVESGCKHIALVAPTAADARDIMVLGESGILGISPPWNKPEPLLSRRRLVWPNGAVAMLYSADEPERLRGHQHDAAWCDEVCAWRYARDAFDMLMLGLRLGTNPRVVITTTPKPIHSGWSTRTYRLPRSGLHEEGTVRLPYPPLPETARGHGLRGWLSSAYSRAARYRWARRSPPDMAQAAITRGFGTLGFPSAHHQAVGASEPGHQVSAAAHFWC